MKKITLTNTDWSLECTMNGNFLTAKLPSDCTVEEGEEVEFQTNRPRMFGRATIKLRR
jgi:hypothetical protein